jgi:hypothetical protein
LIACRSAPPLVRARRGGARERAAARLGAPCQTCRMGAARAAARAAIAAFKSEPHPVVSADRTCGACRPTPGHVVYALRLSGGRYYVGVTLDLERRLSEHLRGVGAAWTRRFVPSASAPLDAVLPCRTPFDEDALTKAYMAVHGVDAVRGGSFVRLTLPAEQVAQLAHEIAVAKGGCLVCGQRGHWVARCPSRGAELR